MPRVASITFIGICVVLRNSVAFSPSLPASRLFGRSSSALAASRQENNDIHSKNQKRTDIRNFLSQRALQTFTFLLQRCRDPHSVKWIEDVLDFSNLNSFHGTGGLNTTLFPEWDSSLEEILARPNDVVVVSVRHKPRNQGSFAKRQLARFKKDPEKDKPKENPYLEERFTEFEIDIDPASLVSRILSVREQISKEWLLDLDTLIQSNECVLDNYLDQQMEARTIKADDRKDDKQNGEVPPANDDADCNTGIVFDKNAMVMLANSISIGKGSTPLRKASFDLLVLLSTQESIHRVLMEYKSQNDKLEDNWTWLSEFYFDRVHEYFDGPQAYGRADEFLEDLLMTSPRLMEGKDGSVSLIDPMRMAEDIIRVRSDVARDWKRVVKAVPEDHMLIRRSVLARQMGEQIGKSIFSEYEEQMKASENLSTETGAFE